MKNLFRRLTRQVEQTPSTTRVRDIVASVLGSYSTSVLNIGARWGDAGAWWRIDPVASTIGFDPDPAECDRLNALCPSSRTERYLPLALGARETQATFYTTAEPACSSLYPPDEALSRRYPQLKVTQVASQSTVQLTPLDAWWEMEDRPSVSFLKIDTQGSELDILKGAQSLLGGCLGCEVEVEFSPIYKGQPLFSDVDTFLRANGFVLWRLKDLCNYSENPGDGEGRLYWANAVYLRDYRTLGQSDEEWRKTMILSVLLEALGDRAASTACLKQALQGLGEPAPEPTLLQPSEMPT